MTKVKTINLRGNQYAQVVDRLNAFRKACPNSKISTESFTQDGVTIFKARVWKNKADFLELLKSGIGKEEALLSADADGTARSDEQDLKKEKGFEKLETIAVGRALAMLGYAASGEIASAEEMDEFFNFKAETFIKDSLECNSMQTLRRMFMDLPQDVQAREDVIKAKDAAKARILEES